MSNNSHFSRLPNVEVPRSRFNRSHNHKTTFDAGKLIPIFCDEVVPGDTFQLSAHGFARLATPIHPVMDDIYVDTFFFFVPNRLVWSNFVKMCGEQDRPVDSTDFRIPQVTCPVDGFPEGSMADYFGIPVNVPGLDVNALPFRAYNLIFNEWFRDQNLTHSVGSPLDDGPDDFDIYNVKRRCKVRDYFTSCLPWPQKGEAVNLPLGTTAPVIGLGKGNSTFNSQANVLESTGHTANYPSSERISSVSDEEHFFVREHPDKPGYPGIFTDLSQATAATVNNLRTAFQVQRLLERDARGGTRYPEIIRNHFGVISDDARLDRPEYLGGGTTQVNLTPIAQTSATDQSVSPQGNLSAMGSVSFSNHGFSRSFTEHGYIIGLVNARSRLSYQQGLHRMWSRRDRYDLYWPAFSHLGEQAVLNKEIYAQGSADPDADDAVFGYQERYAEMRYSPTRITGKFRSGITDSLDAWHLAQDFDQLPTLSNSFIVSNPPIDRVIAVPSQPHFLFDVYFDLNCTRPMPTYSVPGFIDHH